MVIGTGRKQYPKRLLSVRYRKVFVFRIVRSLWNLTGTSAAVLPMCLSNFKAIRQFKVPISWLRDFTRSYEKTSFRILRRGPDRRKWPPAVPSNIGSVGQSNSVATNLIFISTEYWQFQKPLSMRFCNLKRRHFINRQIILELRPHCCKSPLSAKCDVSQPLNMMISWPWNIFSITGPLCGYMPIH